MSSLKRIVSGSSASMVGLVATLVTQVAMVPVFLQHWDAATYGVWLALQGVVTFMTLIDMGHQDFVGFECLRAPVDDLPWRSRVMSSALPFALMTGGALVIVVVLLHLLGVFRLLFAQGATPATASAASGALVVFALSWLVSQCVTGLTGRILASVGDAPLTAWTTLYQNLLATGGQLVGLLLGYHILGVACAQAGIVAAYSVYLHWRFARRLRWRGVAWRRPDLRFGLRNLTHSIVVTVSLVVETLQQAGFRIVLVPLVGPVAVAQFSTLRTVANTAQQGVNTLTNPTVPELMRVASARNAPATRAMLALLWFMSVVLVAPGIVALQFLAPPFYHQWTRGKIAWDGLTFALLSLSIVVNGLGQPGRAVLRGNNLLARQLAVSLVAGVVLLGATWLLVPRLGLAGAAIGLALGEVARAALTLNWSSRWLHSVSLPPPLRTLAITGAIAGTSAAAVLALARWPGGAPVILALFAGGWIAGVAALYLTLPPEVRARLTPVLRRLPLGHFVARKLGG